MALATGTEIAREVLREDRPPSPPPTHLEFARTTKLAAGPREGELYDPDGPLSDPVQRWILEQFDAGEFQRFAFPASPQVAGKTQVGVIFPALRAAICCGAAVGYALPTLEAIDKAWTQKLRPSIAGSGYGDHLPSSGPGSRGGRAPVVTFRHPVTGEAEGSLVFLAGGAFGSTCRVVVIDEADQFRLNGQPDREAIEDCFHRADSFRAAALRVIVGTIEFDEGSTILAYWEDSTRTRPWLGCVHCGEHFRAEWDKHVRYDDTDDETAAATVRLVCPHCGGTHDEDQRQQALRRMRFVHDGQRVERGDVVGPRPRSRTLGLLWTAIDCSLADMRELAQEHRQAREALTKRGDHTPMRKFTRYRLVQPYLADKQTDDKGATVVPTRNRLAALSAASEISIAAETREKDGHSWHMVELPAWVEHITVATDVQAGGDRAPGRLPWVALGRGGGRGVVAGWGSILAGPVGRQPTQAELHRALDFLDGLLRDWAPAAPIVRRGVDVGDQTDELLRWIRSHPSWWAIKGTAPAKAMRGDYPGWLYVRPQQTHTLRLIETKSSLRVVHGELLAKAGPGQLALPRGLERTSALVQHICARVEYAPGKWSETARDRIHHPEWQARNDYAHGLAYARALAYAWEASPRDQKPIDLAQWFSNRKGRR